MEFLLCNDIKQVLGCFGGHGIKIIILTAEVAALTSAEALTFSRLSLSNCLNWKIYCGDNSSLLIKFIKF